MDAASVHLLSVGFSYGRSSPHTETFLPSYGARSIFGSTRMEYAFAGLFVCGSSEMLKNLPPTTQPVSAFSTGIDAPVMNGADKWPMTNSMAKNNARVVFKDLDW